MSESIKFSNDCILKLKIDLKTYDNQKQYYYLSYEWIINDFKNHPFRDDKEYFDNHLDGEIVYKNDITDNLIRFLMIFLPNEVKYIKIFYSIYWPKVIHMRKSTKA